MADSPLAKKLLIKPGQRVVIINPPPGYLEELGQLPEGAQLVEKPDGAFDFVQLFVKNAEELARFAPLVIGAVKQDGILWVSYPKQTSRLKTDITRDRGWGPVCKAGLEPVSQVAINEVWSALRFKPSELVGKRKGE